MTPVQWVVVLAIALFFAMLAFLEAGYRLGCRPSEETESAHKGVGTIEAAVFALLGLLLGFSFAVGITRLDVRRQLIVGEVNAIGTAYLRIDLLPPKHQPEMRNLFREYVDARLRAYQKVRVPDLSGAAQEFTLAAQMQQRIWSLAMNAAPAGGPPSAAPIIVIPALNAMFDIGTARQVALYVHLPPLIDVLLISIALLSALLAGYAMSSRGSRSWLHMLLYAAVIAITVYAVVDLDFPGAGLIRLDAADAALANLRESMR